MKINIITVLDPKRITNDYYPIHHDYNFLITIFSFPTVLPNQQTAQLNSAFFRFYLPIPPISVRVHSLSILLNWPDSSPPSEHDDVRCVDHCRVSYFSQTFHPHSC